MKDYIEYKGKIYRYTYCSKGQGYYRRTETLHRTIWEDHHGEIPKEHHIHHIDGNTRNNAISNLECIHLKEHHRIHFSSAKQIAHLHAVREKAHLWHKSKKGRRRLSKVSKAAWKTREAIPFVCSVCGIAGMTMNRAGTKYCSQKCRSRAGYLAMFVKKKCLLCDSEYQTAHGKTRTCSPLCASRLTAKVKKEKKNGTFPAD